MIIAFEVVPFVFLLRLPIVIPISCFLIAVVSMPCHVGVLDSLFYPTVCFVTRLFETLRARKGEAPKQGPRAMDR